MIPASLVQWFDSHHQSAAPAQDPRRIDLLRLAPFIIVHLACLAVLIVGWSPAAVAMAVSLYVLRMFGITAGYHRLFAHRAFRAPRWVEFAFALLGGSSGQRGALWWAAHHRHHHRHSDTPADLHSPRQHGFWWSHLGWFLADGAFRTSLELVPDLAERRELLWLDRFDIVPPLALAAGCFALGAWLGPAYGTSGMQMLVWFCVSTVVLAHATFCVNSVMHLWGSRPHATTDTSRNHLAMAVLTLGEGWHNEHHHRPGRVRQGSAWWHVDLSWYALLLLRALRLVGPLTRAPAAAPALASARASPQCAPCEST
jgi:stearoyl-CoA desaturase (delta-9 desaturase)